MTRGGATRYVAGGLATESLRAASTAISQPADDVDGWKDLKGNLVEAVLAPGGGFDHRGYGIGWGTLKYHKVQSTTPRFKNATTGARCMRFK